MKNYTVTTEIKEELFYDSQFHFLPSHEKTPERAYKLYFERFNNKMNQDRELIIPELYIEHFNNI